MALVSFGGGSDPSGLLASLNRQYLEDIEALAERATRRADERSDADDRDMFDKWQNGLIDDAAWLAYIAKRVQETAGDPVEHQKWIETQREYVTTIADNKMEFAYENGQASINEVIRYYRERLSGLKPDSQAYREISQRLFQYVDKQSGDDIQSGAQDITDRIVMGQASLGDLINFYRQRLAGLRPNSSLYEKIQQEIRDLQSRQIQDAYSGSGSSGGGGGGGRRSSGGADWGSTSDQYQAATESGIVPRSDIVSAALWERDNLGISRSAREFSGTLPGMTEAQSDDYIQGARAHAKWMMEQFADEDSDSVIIDPHTGVEWQNTPENMRQWAYEYIDLSEMRARGQESGEDTDESNARGARNDIGDAVRAAQRVNAIPIVEAADRINAEYQRQLNIAERTGDPDNVLRVNAIFGREFEKLGRNAILNKPRSAHGAQPLEGEERPAKSPLKNAIQRAPESIAEELIARGQLLRAYGRGNIDQIQQAQATYMALPDHDEDLVDADITVWNDIDEGIPIEGGSSAYISMVARRMKDGLDEGAYVRVYDHRNGGNGISVVPMARTRTFDPVTGRLIGSPVPMDSNFDPSNGDRWEKIYVDDRNGNPVEALVISRLEPSPLMTFVAGSGLRDRYGNAIPAGTKLTASIINQLGEARVKSGIATGAITLGSAQNVRAYTFKSGNTYIKQYWDEDLKAWSDVPYHRQGLDLRSVNGTLAVVLDDDHTLGGNMRPFAHIRGRPLNYHGRNPQKFQEMIDRGEIEIPHWGNYVDHLGQIQVEREAEKRRLWYDDDFQRTGTGIVFRGTPIQPSDPSYTEGRLRAARAGMFGSEERERRGELRERRRDEEQENRPPSFGTIGVMAGLSSLFSEFNIFQGDPSKRMTGPIGKEQDIHTLAQNASNRVALAEERRLLEERNRINLPKIALPARTGLMSNPVTLPTLPVFMKPTTAPMAAKVTTPSPNAYLPSTTAPQAAKVYSPPAPAPKPSLTKPKIL